ncbi:MAG: SDR family NAD(P)-dependent oxidoreductase [Gammaproteobacteria bacterium]|nr:SDR family NAD(P)-dependent oxidoreductase [Gammaproteobacteria bacterium]MXW45185.1 SDR family oxidoreductase [Gammaproteobacteria bacterium]MYD01841.1 SDR family oxidoreductase [Gammaproteobacteria bacterium]MYI26050.1 SDR family oxidoreductase [Gammaproteobacteria bacterium]
MSMMDRHVAIAGGGRGIGEALCRSFIRQGAKLLVIDKLDARSLEFGFRPLEEADAGQLRYRQCDVTRSDQVREFAAESQDFFGGQIDVFVNCVGINMPRSMLELAEDDWDRVMDTNVKGAFLLSSAVAPMMKAGGAMVFLSSATALQPGRADAAYALSKMTLNRLTTLLAAEVAERGIRLNAVCPGPILSDRVMDERLIDPITSGHRTAEEVREEILSEMPLARFHQTIPPVESVVDAVNFLIGDEARFITGAVLPVDAGKSLSGI